jgi:hypothetical protein
MKNLNTRKWSTPVTIGSGIFVTITGILMFFGVHGPLGLAHEWIGLIFAAAILLHVLNHLRAFSNYFSQRFAVSIVALTFVASSAFLSFGAVSGGGNPMMGMVKRIEASPLTEVAPLIDQSPEAVLKIIQSAGYTVTGVDASLQEIATANGTQSRALIEVIF